MKKVITLILAVAMIASMGIVASFAEETAETGCHTSFDLIYASCGPTHVLASANDGTTSAVTDLGKPVFDPTDGGIVFNGWHIAKSEILCYGTRVNGGEITWEDIAVHEAEQAILDIAAGFPEAQDATRFIIAAAPLYKGEDVTCELLVKTAGEGEYVIWTAMYDTDRAYADAPAWPSDEAPESAPATEVPATQAPETEATQAPEAEATQAPEAEATQAPENNNDTADNTAIVFMIAAAAVVATVLLKKRAYNR